MKALFITTKTNECVNHVRAWNSIADIPSDHITYDHMAIRNDAKLLEKARLSEPDVIFYIGAAKALGNPRAETLLEMRQMAPLIHLCSDATDKPWHPVLAGYRTRGCFDLQVAIDGARNAPVDMSTLTPVDPGPFVSYGPRDIKCGFSGTVGRWNERSEVLSALKWFNWVTIRAREATDGYEDHARFLTWCRMLLNFSWTGSGHAHHMKGRVVEAGMAGCALLEHVDSPISDWLPKGCWIPWSTVKNISEIISDITDNEITSVATSLSDVIKQKWTPKMIYGSMLEKVGINVGLTVQKPAA